MDDLIEKLAASNASLLARMSNVADGAAVTNEQEYTEAAAKLRDIKALQKDADNAQKAITQPMENRKRAVIAWFRENVGMRLEVAENSLKRAILAYQQEQQRIAREKQRVADEAARKERERIQRQAAAAAAKGNVEREEQLLDRAQMVVAPVIQTEAPKVQGMSTRDVWKWEITDPALVPREYLVVDEVKIGKVVRALKGDTTIPGVRVWAEQTLAAAS